MAVLVTNNKYIGKIKLTDIGTSQPPDNNDLKWATKNYDL